MADARPRPLRVTRHQGALAVGLLLGVSALTTTPTRAEPAPAPAPLPASAPAAAPEPDPGAASGVYLRLGGGLDWPAPTVFSDADGCASLQPPALFGCGAGEDGRTLGARSGVRQSPVLEAGLGYRVTPWLRAEALLSWRPQLDLSGQANFLGAGSDQPVSLDAASLAGFGVAYVDLPRIGGVQPFLGAGLGLARNRLRTASFRFPSIAAEASTSLPSGTSTDLAWLLTAGISLPLSERLALDLAYRFTELGSLTSSSGTATVVRPSGQRSIAIGGTTADLQSQGVMLSLRYAF